MDIQDLCRRIIDNPIQTPSQTEMTHFLHEMTGFISQEPNIIRLKGRTLWVGDIHGDLDSMLAALEVAAQRNSNIIFVGDMVDRGSHDPECVNLFLAHKFQHPDSVFFTRGNHEFKDVNSRWGFMDSVVDRYPETTYWLYNGLFTQLPIAALQNEKIFGVHGGVSRHLKTLEEIEAYPHDSRTSRDEYLDLLWNDPAEGEQEGFEMNNKRGIFYTFGQDGFDQFMEANGLELFIRGHTVQNEGYKYYFDKRLISIFSSADHYKDTKPSAVLVEDDASHEIIPLSS